MKKRNQLVSQQHARKCLMKCSINKKLLLIHIQLWCYFNVSTVESNLTERLYLMKFSDDASSNTNEATPMEALDFTSNFIEQSSLVWNCSSQSSHLNQTRRYCARIKDNRSGLQWSRNISKRRFSKVLVVNDFLRHKWIIWRRENIFMFGLESNTIGQYHFARKYDGPVIRLTEPQNEEEIELYSKDPRYFKAYHSLHDTTFSVYFQHLNSSLYVSTNKTSPGGILRQEVILIQNQEKAIHHWTVDKIM